MTEKGNEYVVLVAKPEGKRPLERTKHRCVNNIKTSLKEIEWGGVVWTGLIWLEGTCEHGNESSGSIKCWEILEQLHNWWPLKKGSTA
jgi:hypothetical protein